MEPTILAHIILGSTLSLFIILTAYYLLRMLLSPEEKKAVFNSRLRRSAIITIILFVAYMGWVFIKKSVLG